MTSVYSSHECALPQAPVLESSSRDRDIQEEQDIEEKDRISSASNTCNTITFTPLAQAWCPTACILAVAYNDNSIRFHGNDGKLIPNLILHTNKEDMKQQQQQQQQKISSSLSNSQEDYLHGIANRNKMNYGNQFTRSFQYNGFDYFDNQYGATNNGKGCVKFLEWQPGGKVLAAIDDKGGVYAWCIDIVRVVAASCSDSQNDSNKNDGGGQQNDEDIRKTLSFVTSFNYNKNVHSFQISFMVWNPMGSRLITGDKAGLLCVWKTDKRGSLIPAIQYRKSSPLTKAVFAALPSTSTFGRNITSNENNHGGSHKNLTSPFLSLSQKASSQTNYFNFGNNSYTRTPLSPSFFFGTETGVVCYADDLGHCSEVSMLATSVDTMAFYEEKSRLIIISRSLFLTQLQLQQNGTVTTLSKVKLSIAQPGLGLNKQGISSCTWVGPGLLSTASGENLVRVWDFNHDGNYTLTVPNVEEETHHINEESKMNNRNVVSISKGKNSTGSIVQSLSFSPLSRTLAVGTKDGRCILYQFRGEYSRLIPSPDKSNNTDNDNINEGSSNVKYNKELTTSMKQQQQLQDLPLVSVSIPSSANDWQLLPPSLLTKTTTENLEKKIGNNSNSNFSSISNVSWGLDAQGNPILSALTEKNVFVLDETIMHRCIATFSRPKSSRNQIRFSEDRALVAMQLSINQVRIEYTTEIYDQDHVINSTSNINQDDRHKDNKKSSYVLDTELNIKGMCISTKYLVLWSGKMVEVYEHIYNDKVEYGNYVSSERIASFPCSTSCIAIHPHTETLYICSTIPSLSSSSQGGINTIKALQFSKPNSNEKGNTSEVRVDICNLQGVTKSSINFDQLIDGVPTCLDIKNTYLAIATDTGIIKVFDVKGREPRVICDGGKFVDQKSGQNIGMIKSIKVNADGSRVSIISNKVHNQGNLKLHTPCLSLYVFDVGKDAIFSFDCSQVEGGRYPLKHEWDSTEPKILLCEGRKLRDQFQLQQIENQDYLKSIKVNKPLPLSGDKSSSALPEGENIASAKNLTDKSHLYNFDYNTIKVTKRGDVRSEDDDEDDNSETSSNDGISGAKFIKEKSKGSEEKTKSKFDDELVVLSLLATSDGILLQDSLPLSPPLESIVGVQVPRLIFASNLKIQIEDDNEKQQMTESKFDDLLNEDIEDAYHHKSLSKNEKLIRTKGVSTRILRDFEGISTLDEESRRALLDFSYFLAIQNMDEAYKAVRCISSVRVWESMANTCLKTGRLDVAEICLGHMGHERGAAAVRVAKGKGWEPEAVLAIVAVQLGRVEEATILCKKIGRMDICNTIMQEAGEWEKAIYIARNYDHIHLKKTYHAYAMYLESIGDINAAISNYELAGTFKIEVPRMLCKLGQITMLEDYILEKYETYLSLSSSTGQEISDANKDNNGKEDDALQLLAWWGAYMESQGETEKAKKIYRKSKDLVNLVRLMCLDEETERIAEVIESHKENLIESGKLGRKAKGSDFSKEADSDTEIDLDNTENNKAKQNKNLIAACCYHFASHLERSLPEDIQNETKGEESSHSDMSKIALAIKYFAEAGSYSHCIRLAKRYHLDNEIMTYAMKASAPVMLDAARYFEDKNQHERAVHLYQKGGDISGAMSLCFRIGKAAKAEKKRLARERRGKGPGIHQENNNAESMNIARNTEKAMFEMLSSITESMKGSQNNNSNLNSEMLANCADFFIEHGHYDKAVQLYILSSRGSEAIQLCVAHKVKISEETAEAILNISSTSSISQSQGNVAPSSHRRDKSNESVKDRSEKDQNVMMELAKACKGQGSYDLACQLYTKAGDRLRALRCLIKSGNTKAIMHYAQKSRSKELYILAANYLQTLDWQQDADIMKAIITFYTKAKAYEQLASFYDACAQVEIDDYRDYDKALGALREALKNLSKDKEPTPSKERLMQSLQEKIRNVETFANARKLCKSDPDTMVKVCLELLDVPDIENSIRQGDCFALLIEYYYSIQQYEDAKDLIDQMRSRRIQLRPFLEQDMLSYIFKVLRLPFDIDEIDNYHDDYQSMEKDHGEYYQDQSSYTNNNNSLNSDNNVDTPEEVNDEVEEDIDEVVDEDNGESEFKEREMYYSGSRDRANREQFDINASYRMQEKVETQTSKVHDKPNFNSSHNHQVDRNSHLSLDTNDLVEDVNNFHDQVDRNSSIKRSEGKDADEFDEVGSSRSKSDQDILRFDEQELRRSSTRSSVDEVEEDIDEDIPDEIEDLENDDDDFFRK